MAGSGAIKVNGVQLATFASGEAHFERLQAGDGADVLAGNGLRNQIYGGRGNDRISGGGGVDLLVGERGNDRLAGGSGADIFEFRRGFGRDQITDWQNDIDSLRLDDALWGGGKTVLQVLKSFGSIAAGAAVLTFGDNAVLTIHGVTKLGSLADDIILI
jgi:serralysin